MPKALEGKGNTDSRRLAAIDQLLMAGIRLGPAKKREAINRVLQLVPDWTRSDCWNRIRHLRKTSAPDIGQERAPDKPKRSAKPAPIPRSHQVPWTASDDDQLFKLAGYEPVRKIAQRLGRTVGAVRFRLGALGMSAKVTDGWSLRELRKLLRVSPARLRYLIGSGILRVRDPRVTRNTLAAYCAKNSPSLNPSAQEGAHTVFDNGDDAFSWEQTAEILGLAVAQVQSLISAGQLKLVDPFVTDRSFEEFCRKHSKEINSALIDPRTMKWLVTEYGVSATGTNGGAVSRSRKHALVIRTCQCGKKIAGNPYFRHLRACRHTEEAGPTIPWLPAVEPLSYFKVNHSTTAGAARRHTKAPEKSSGTKTLL
jgi:hypothetical protein